MSVKKDLVVNGWILRAHPIFLGQYEKLIHEVETFRKKHPQQYKQKNATKRLAAIQRLAFEMIPADPMPPDYRLGNTLGDEHKHWFRAKFFQQYRLFFRYHKESKIIVYAWVNDEDTKRAYESNNDAYKIFKKMLAKNRPPDDWNILLSEAKNDQRFQHPS